MTILKLIEQCEIRLEYLKQARISNIQLDNNQLVNKLDIEILELQETIDKLKNTN